MPMDSAAALRGSDLATALEAAKAEVRSSPTNARPRTLLFQLFCVTADWDRALVQLTAACELDPAALPMAQTYRALIRLERLRTRVFEGLTSPTIFGEPEPWMPPLLEAVRLLGQGEPDAAAELRDTAFDAAPASTGTIGEEALAWIADADPRLGPMLEAVVDGRYFWVPFHRLARLRLEPPADLRDQVWMPAGFTWSNGGEQVGFIHTRYPGTTPAQAAAEPALALARRTEFTDHGQWSIPRGQRMLATEAGEYPLQDVRDIVLTPGS